MAGSSGLQKEKHETPRKAILAFTYARPRFCGLVSRKRSNPHPGQASPAPQPRRKAKPAAKSAASNCSISIRQRGRASRLEGVATSRRQYHQEPPTSKDELCRRKSFPPSTPDQDQSSPSSNKHATKAGNKSALPRRMSLAGFDHTAMQ